MELLAIPAIAGVVLVLVLGAFLIARKRATARQYAAVTRVYERRVLAACGGDKAAMIRLVNEQAKAVPSARRHVLMKQVLERLQLARGHH